MGATTKDGRQIRNEGVFREDLNATTTTKAVIKKGIAGVGVETISTGVDDGTGDVTFTVPKITAIVAEAIAASAIVDLYSNSGVLTVRNASASATYATALRPAVAFCLVGQATVNGSTTVDVYTTPGAKITGLSGLTAGVDYYLSATTAGGMVDATTASAYTGGQLIMKVGKAISSSVIVFNPELISLTS